MKLIFNFLILLLFSISANANARLPSSYNYKITKVIDGDTVEFVADFLPEPLKPSLSLRLYGVDTPDIGHHAKCPKEDFLGMRAKNFTQDFINNSHTISVVIIKWDKYGGRVNGDIIGDGKSLRRALLRNHLAVEYKGDKKPDWCSIIKSPHL